MNLRIMIYELELWIMAHEVVLGLWIMSYDNSYHISSIMNYGL